MNKNLIAEASIEINAPANQIWDALTNPDKIKIYLFGTQTTTDWKVGSPIKFEGSFNETTYQDKGNVLENEENKFLKYNYWSSFSGLPDSPENYALVSYSLEPSDNGVKLTWKQVGFSSEEGHCHTEQALGGILEKIKELAEA